MILLLGLWLEGWGLAGGAPGGPTGRAPPPPPPPAPLVKVQDQHTLLLPERRGNNRIDSLRNIVADPRVALLFLIPGTGETLRVNGTARISVAPELLASTAIDGQMPKCVIEIKIDTVFFQCARAMKRSGLWEHTRAPASVPTAGAMLAALTDARIDGARYDQELPERQRTTLY
jgi:PPOX class probable FMN-dependent enzyme